MFHSPVSKIWFDLAETYNSLVHDSSVVILCRSTRAIEGRLSRAEAERMVEEKSRALASAIRAGVYASWTLTSPAAAAQDILEPFHSEVNSNVERLRRD